MHRLQKYILDTLRFEQPLSYSGMLPKDIESSLFQYHLRTLVNDGLVQKEATGLYSLTTKGSAALEYMSVNHSGPVRMPKVITYTLLTHKDTLVLLQKPKEPYRGNIEPIGGKVHFGEDVSDAAQREVWEKLQLRITRPRLVGVATVLISQQGEPITHMVVYAHHSELAQLPQSLPALCVTVRKADLLERTDYVPTTLKLIQMILAAKEPFVTSLQADV